MNSNLLTIILISLIVSIYILSKSLFSFILFLLFPTLISLIFKKQFKNRCLTASIISFNLIGAIPFTKQIFYSSNLNIVASKLVKDPFTWLVVYGSTILGLFFYFIIPALIAKVYLAKAAIKISSLEEKRDILVEEWGIETSKINKILKSYQEKF